MTLVLHIIIYFLFLFLRALLTERDFHNVVESLHR